MDLINLLLFLVRKPVELLAQFLKVISVVSHLNKVCQVLFDSHLVTRGLAALDDILFVLLVASFFQILYRLLEVFDSLFKTRCI